MKVNSVSARVEYVPFIVNTVNAYLPCVEKESGFRITIAGRKPPWITLTNLGYLRGFIL